MATTLNYNGMGPETSWSYNCVTLRLLATLAPVLEMLSQPVPAAFISVSGPSMQDCDLAKHDGEVPWKVMFSGNRSQALATQTCAKAQGRTMPCSDYMGNSWKVVEGSIMCH